MGDPLEAAHRYWNTCNNGTDDYIEDCTTDDLVFSLDGAVTAAGREATRAAARDVLFLMPDRRVEATNVFAVGNVVCAQLRVTGTFAESRPGMLRARDSFSSSYAVVLLIRDGLVAAEHAFSGAAPGH